MVSISCILILLILLLGLAYCEESSPSAERKKKGEALLFAGFSPVTTLLIVKFKLVLLALFLLIGTAATTKFVAGLFHFLGYSKRRRPYKPIYVKGIKYEQPHYESFQTYDKPYYDDPYFTHYAKNSLEKAIRNIDRSKLID